MPSHLDTNTLEQPVCQTYLCSQILCIASQLPIAQSPSVQSPNAQLPNAVIAGLFSSAREIPQPGFVCHLVNQLTGLGFNPLT